MAKKTTAKKPGTAKPPGMKIKKGDHVVVIAGRDRGREGAVVVAYPDQQRLIVHGVNMIKKNTKVDYQGRRGAKEGGIIHQEAPIHISNVQLIDPDTKKPARAGYRRDDDSKKIRISRSSGKDI
jgi:large subunit ribosomal protein L24